MSGFFIARGNIPDNGHTAFKTLLMRGFFLLGASYEKFLREQPMPKPTIQQLFGSNATVTSSELTIKFSDFSSVGWNTAAGTTDAEKWLTAILLKAREFSVANTDQIPNVVVQEPYPGLLTRNNTVKREYSYNVQVYVPDTSTASPDPDLI